MSTIIRAANFTKITKAAIRHYSTSKNLPIRPIKTNHFRVTDKKSRSSSALVTRLRPIHLSASVKESFFSVAEGQKDTLEYRLYFKDTTGQTISPWHDIPLFSNDGNCNFVCEIPKNTTAKMEVATDEKSTPIKQDVKKGALRHYPYEIYWNYGCLPQTWEDPSVKNEETDTFGDNDPLDCVEIGSKTLTMGSVHKVKPLGVYAMIDGGEMDWKVVSICTDDPKAPVVNDVQDVEREFPGQLQKIMEWFRDYKIPDGKPANTYGYDAECLNKKFCMNVIQETNEFWKSLKSGKRENTESLSLS